LILCQLFKSLLNNISSKFLKDEIGLSWMLLHETSLYEAAYP